MITPEIAAGESVEACELAAKIITEEIPDSDFGQAQAWKGLFNWTAIKLLDAIGQVKVSETGE